MCCGFFVCRRPRERRDGKAVGQGRSSSAVALTVGNGRLVLVIDSCAVCRLEATEDFDFLRLTITHTYIFSLNYETSFN